MTAQINVSGGEKANRECPNCHSKKNWKRGKRENQFGSIQRFICRECGSSFSEKSYKDYQLSNNSQLCAKLEAKKLDTATELKTVARDNNEQGEIIAFLWHLKKQGYSESTIHTRVKILKFMRKQSVNLQDPEAVKLFIAKREEWSNGHKQIAVTSYDGFAEMLKIKWEPPFYENNKTLPFVPTEKEVNALVSACSKKIATSLLAMKETGFRIGELWKCKWTDLDEENSTLKCIAEKHGNPRQIKISSRLVSMLLALPKINDYIFANSNLNGHRWRFDKQKKALSIKLQNPRLKQIKFHSMRHFKASKKYTKPEHTTRQRVSRS